MAKEEAPAAEAEEQVPKKKGKLILILAVVAVLVLGGGVAAFLLLSQPDAEQTEVAEAEVEDKTPPVYERLETFTVNLSDQQSYLQTDIQLLLGNAEVQAKIKQRMPEVRDALIRLLSSKNTDELTQQEGKDALATEIAQAVNAVLKVEDEAEGVKKVLFASFIIQG